MKCKYCQAELEEDMNLCPACGKEQNEPAAEAVAEERSVETAPAEEKNEPVEIKEGIKATPGKIALAIAAGVVVLALLVAIVISGIDGDLFKGKEETLPPEAGAVAGDTVPATEGTVPPDGNPEDVTCKGSYTVSDDVINGSRDTVVAVAGDKELTVAQLQVYYWECVYETLGQLGGFAIQFGLDPAQPLDTQLCQISDVPMTWQQYFLDYALSTWHSHQTMALEAAANNTVLSDDLQQELNMLPQQIQEMASTGGFETTEDWIYDYIGPGCSVEDFLNYMDIFYQGYGYMEHLQQTTAFTADQVEAYYTENEGTYAEAGIVKSDEGVDVRHILLVPGENPETGEDGYPVYTDDQWAACEVEAQKIYDEWLAGDKSEQSFADFAVKYSADGNAAQGGIYEGVTKGRMVEAFNDWCFDETRQSGDHGLVKTQFGYHIMYFVKSSPIRYVNVRHILLMPENGTTGEDGYPVYPDADWAVCEAEATKIYDEWKSGNKSEQSFADFAAKYSEDGNAADGGIYEGVTKGYMVEAFDAWCFDEARQSGDHGLVKTQFGYHIMYFAGDMWYATAEADLREDRVSAAVPAAMEKHPMTVDYSAIMLGDVDLGAKMN